MELFTIDCTTCRARLKVRGPEVIGQIMACPRCASMVHVSPPPGWTLPDIANGDTKPVRHAGPPPLPKRQSRIQSGNPPPLPKHEPAHAVVRAHSARPRDVQFWLPVASACLAGVVLGLSVWLLTVMRPAQTTTEPVAALDTATPPATFPTDPAAQQIVVNRPASVPDAATAKPPRPVTAQPKADAAQAAPTSKRPAAPAVTKPTVSTPPTTAIASASTKTVPSPGAKLTLTDATTHGRVLTDGAAPPTTAAAGKPTAPVKPAFDLEARLADKLGKMDFQKVPLQYFVRTVSDFSTIPITIDEAALTRAGKNAKLPVSVQNAGATVAETLRTALEPAGLMFRKAKDHLVVTTAEPRS